MAVKKVCGIEGCSKPVCARGWCIAHYWRWRRYGDPLGKSVTRGTRAWLLAHVSYTGFSCLTWPFGIHPIKGYPTQIWVAKDRQRPTRIMCELAHGPAPTPEHHAAHSCHNGRMGCIHPQHLHWATNAENKAESRAFRRCAGIAVRGAVS